LLLFVVDGFVEDSEEADGVNFEVEVEEAGELFIFVF